MTPMETARACTEILHENDLFAKHCHLVPESTAPQEAIASLFVEECMLNGHGICHGGMIFTLADTVFAHACNNENKANVAMDCRIDFLSPANLGDTLTAVAHVKHTGRRSSVYEVVVVNQDRKSIALFTGRSYYINKSVLDENNDD